MRSMGLVVAISEPAFRRIFPAVGTVPEAEVDLFRFNVRKQSLHSGHTLFNHPRCVICIGCQIAGALLYLGSGPNLGIFDKSLQCVAMVCK